MVKDSIWDNEYEVKALRDIIKRLVDEFYKSCTWKFRNKTGNLVTIHSSPNEGLARSIAYIAIQKTCDVNLS